MIIQVRGTSGSGKSTVVREVMKCLAPWNPVMVPGRRKPLYYRTGNVAVVGHYEAPCGGGDTIGSAPEVCLLATELDKKFQYVVCEGLLLSEDTKWSFQLSNLRVVFLTTDLETCLNRIKRRRSLVGNEKELNPHNTSNRVAVIERARLKLIGAGILCRRVSSEQAPSLILSWINEI